MKYVVSIVALIAMAIVYTSAQTMATGDNPKPVAVAVDPFIGLIKEIEASSFFPALSFNYRLLTFEMLSAAETKHLKALLDRLGYIVLLEYLDALPADYQHRFISYSVDHLRDENEYYGVST